MMLLLLRLCSLTFSKKILDEGILNAGFTPVFSDYLANNKPKEAFHIFHVMVTIVGCILSVLAIGIIMGTEIILGIKSISSRMSLTLQLLQWMTPYMICACLATLMAGLLNIYKYFAISRLAPILLNIFWIIALYTLCPYWGDSLQDQIFGLALGVLCAGVFQIIIYIPVAKSLGLRVFRLSFDIKHSGVKEIFFLMLPVLLSFAINQLNYIIDICLAYFLGEGMQSFLWYSQRIIYFPVGVFGVAMATVILPKLSLYATKKQFMPMKETLLYSIRLALMFAVPCAVAIMILNKEMVSLFYERGAFDAQSVEQTALALLCYSFGLVALVINKILLATYYSLKSTRTPVVIGFYCVIVNLVLNLLLIGYLKQGGIALATGVTALINMFWLLYKLRKTLQLQLTGEITRYLGKMILVGLVLGLVYNFTVQWVYDWAWSGLLYKIALVFVPLSIGFVVAIFLYYVMGLGKFVLLAKPE